MVVMRVISGEIGNGSMGYTTGPETITIDNCNEEVCMKLVGSSPDPVVPIPNDHPSTV